MTPRIHRLDAAPDAAQLQQLADLLIDCVHHGASVSFMAPLSNDTALAFWRGVAEGVARGERALLVALDDASVVVGTVQLVLAQPENQPQRADIAKMLVHSRARRQGLGERLMRAVEAEAVTEGKRTLVLDTVTGGAGERLYTRCGWTRVGDIPDYALMPDGAPCGTTLFYRHLAPA